MNTSKELKARQAMLDEAISNLKKIESSELGAFYALGQLLKHIAGTYGDKYMDKNADWIQTKKLLLSKNGKFANLHSAGKYMQRYSTTGFAKSDNIADLLKAIHYLMFEYQRRTTSENTTIDAIGHLTGNS